MIFIGKISKGNDSIKNVGGVTVSFIPLNQRLTGF